MKSFPIPAPAFDGNSRALGVNSVFTWLRFGWNLFLANPGIWVMSTVILILGSLALAMVWLVGPLLTALLLPVFTAGLLAMCRRAALGETLSLSDLAAGFTLCAGPLMTLGLLFALIALAIKLATLLFIGGSVAGGVMLPGLAGIGLMLGGLFIALLFSLLFIPLSMLLWLASALVLFNGMPPLGACRASLSACIKNIVPFLVLSLIACVLFFFAALPAGLGFLVLIPVLAGTAYAAYQDIFVLH